MAAYQYDLGIIGGGSAGLTAAAGGARFGARTILLEKAGRLGGDCLHTGCVPSKTLIRSASLWHHARRAAEFGLPALELPPVDLKKVMGRVHEVIGTIQHHDSPERFRRLGAEVGFGTPRFVNEHEVEMDGCRISAKAWIIATGSSPALPPVEGLEQIPYWTNENVFLQKTLPNRLLVLGGGPVGIELAQAFQRLGSRVTVVEFNDQILSPEDSDMARILLERLTSEGLAVRTRTKAVRVEKAGIGIRVVARPAEGGELVLEGDALLVATGRRPNVAGLGLETAGVDHSPRGIVVDARMKTSVSHIHAAGDVNGGLYFTHVAGYEAGVALANAVVRLPRRADYTKVAWCTYTDPELASVGYNEKRAREAGIEYRVIEEDFRDNDRARAEGATGGKMKVLITPGGRPVGCQIVGPHAGELIHEWVAVIGGKMKLSTLAGAIHAYPTLAEISRKAASDYMAEKIFSDSVRKFLHVVFRLQGPTTKEER